MAVDAPEIVGDGLAPGELCPHPVMNSIMPKNKTTSKIKNTSMRLKYMTNYIIGI